MKSAIIDKVSSMADLTTDIKCAIFDFLVDTEMLNNIKDALSEKLPPTYYLTTIKETLETNKMAIENLTASWAEMMKDNIELETRNKQLTSKLDDMYDILEDRGKK